MHVFVDSVWLGDLDPDFAGTVHAGVEQAALGAKYLDVVGGVAVVAAHHRLVVLEDAAVDLRRAHLDRMDGFGALQGQGHHEKPGRRGGNGTGSGQAALGGGRVHGILALLNSETG